MNPPSFTPQVTIPQWLELDMPVRLRLKELFAVPRSSGSEVHNSVVVSDGHTHKDLAYITKEKMQVFLDTKEQDFFNLWNATIKKVYQAWELSLKAQADLLQQEKTQLDKEKINSMRELTQELEQLANSAEEAMAPKRRGRPKKIAV